MKIKQLLATLYECDERSLVIDDVSFAMENRISVGVRLLCTPLRVLSSVVDNNVTAQPDAILNIIDGDLATHEPYWRHLFNDTMLSSSFLREWMMWIDDPDVRQNKPSIAADSTVRVVFDSVWWPRFFSRMLKFGAVGDRTICGDAELVESLFDMGCHIDHLLLMDDDIYEKTIVDLLCSDDAMQLVRPLFGSKSVPRIDLMPTVTRARTRLAVFLNRLCLEQAPQHFRQYKEQQQQMFDSDADADPASPLPGLQAQFMLYNDGSTTNTNVTATADSATVVMQLQYTASQLAQQRISKSLNADVSRRVGDAFLHLIIRIVDPKIFQHSQEVPFGHQFSHIVQEMKTLRQNANAWYNSKMGIALRSRVRAFLYDTIFLAF